MTTIGSLFDSQRKKLVSDCRLEKKTIAIRVIVSPDSYADPGLCTPVPDEWELTGKADGFLAYAIY